MVCLQGIQWISVDYFNNAVICDLIEKVCIAHTLLSPTEAVIMCFCYDKIVS